MKQTLILSLIGYLTLYIQIVWRFFLCRVAGDSMLPTLHSGDLLLLRRPGHFRRGGLVVFADPSRQRTFVKRVIALPGDRVAIRAGRVWLNGEALTETYALIDEDQHMAELRLAKDTLFLLGDQRRISYDSSDSRVGPVPFSWVSGCVLMVIWPARHCAWLWK